MTDNLRIIGVGSALLDVLARIPEPFLETVSGAKGGMELVSAADIAALQCRLPANAERVPGGSAANTIIGLSRLGLSTRLLSKIGNDLNGKHYIENAARAGVDTCSFKTSPDEPTGVCVSLVTPDTQRTMRTFLGASASIGPEDITPQDFHNCAYAHIEGYILYSPPYAKRVLETAREAGCCISLDLASPEVVGALHDGLPDLLRDYVDIVLANEDEAAAFVGSRDATTALDALSKLCATAVVKLGPEGVLIRRDNITTAVAARKVKAVDTTGAGDLWASGFLYGLASGRSVQEAGRIGAAIGAEVVQVIGASIDETTWDQIRSEWSIS